MKALAQDTWFAVRTLRRRPGFASIAAATLAMGVGATTAIFSVVDGVLLSDLALPEADELVSIWTFNPETPDQVYNNSGPNIRDWQQQADWFEGVYAWGTGDMVYTNRDGLTDLLPVVHASANVLEVLGVSPVLGRPPTSSEEGDGSPDVALLGHNLWSTRFGADPGVVGTSMALDGRPHEIIGVLPATFDVPLAAEADAIIPWSVDIASRPRDIVWLGATARLKSGVSLAAAQSAMDGLHSAVSESFPAETVNSALRVIGAKDDIVGDVKPALLLLLGATGFLLLMACANVANLLLARSTGRASELAVRRSLGASRSRVIRQLVTENLVLALVAGAGGVVMAYVGKDALLALAPEGLPRIGEVAMDTRVLGFALLVVLVTGVLFGVVPSVLATRFAPGSLIRDGRGTVSHREGRRLRNALVATQLAVATVLMVGAGLLIQSFARLTSVNPGYEVEGVLVAELTLPPTGYEEAERRGAFYSTLIERAKALPGVDAVGVTLFRPLTDSRINYELRVEGEPVPEPGAAPVADLGIATEGYFRTFRIPLLRGRGFGPQDTRDTPRVVVLSDGLAQELFPSADPIGQRVALMTGALTDEPTWREVVGVVGDIRAQRLGDDPNPTLYTNALQQPQGRGSLVIRTTVDPDGLRGALRDLIVEAEPQVPLPSIRAMNVVKRESLAAPRFYALLMAVFAGLSLALSSIGVYGVLSYAVAARTAEIGVRVSFGAMSRDIVRMIVTEGVFVAGLGILVGLSAALALSWAMESMLFGVGATDPVTFLGIAAILAGVALAACAGPAIRASNVDPAVALRGD